MNKVPCKVCCKLIHKGTVLRHEKLHTVHGPEVTRFSADTIKLYKDHVKSLLDNIIEVSETSAVRQIVCRPELLPTYEKMFEKLTPIVECDKKGLIGLHLHFIGTLNDCFKENGSNMTYYEQRKHYGLKGNAKTNGCAILLENRLHICHALIYIMGPGNQFPNEPMKYHKQPEGLKSLTFNQATALKKYLIKILHLEDELAELKTTKKYRLKSYIAKKMIYAKQSRRFELNQITRDLLKDQLDQGIINIETYDKFCPKPVKRPTAVVYAFKDTFDIHKGLPKPTATVHPFNNM